MSVRSNQQIGRLHVAVNNAIFMSMLQRIRDFGDLICAAELERRADTERDVAAFLAAGGTKVQLDKVTHLHSAFVQCLMKFRPQLELKETEGFVADLLAKSGLTASKT